MVDFKEFREVTKRDLNAGPAALYLYIYIYIFTLRRRNCAPHGSRHTENNITYICTEKKSIYNNNIIHMCTYKTYAYIRTYMYYNARPMLTGK